MNKFLNYQQLIDHYDKEILTEIVETLKTINYLKIQYIPTRHSLLAIVKEHENNHQTRGNLHAPDALFQVFRAHGRPDN